MQTGRKFKAKSHTAEGTEHNRWLRVSRTLLGLWLAGNAQVVWNASDPDASRRLLPDASLRGAVWDTETEVQGLCSQLCPLKTELRQSTLGERTMGGLTTVPRSGGMQMSAQGTVCAFRVKAGGTVPLLPGKKPLRLLLGALLSGT